MTLSEIVTTITCDAATIIVVKMRALKLVPRHVRSMQGACHSGSIQTKSHRACIM
jgi:hypothetical protein